jgi:glutamine synthetase
MLSKRKLSRFSTAKFTSEYYGKYVFTRSTMEKYLSKDVIKALDGAIEKGLTLDRKIADSVSTGMKMWAMELGCNSLYSLVSTTY